MEQRSLEFTLVKYFTKIKWPNYIEMPCLEFFIFDNNFFAFLGDWNWRFCMEYKIHIPVCQKLFNIQGSLRETISQEKYNLNGSTVALWQDAIQFRGMGM